MNEEKQYSRTAITLFSLSVLMVFSILLFNVNLYQNQLDYRTKLRWYEETSTMLGKLRAFRQRNAAFFQGLAVSMVFNEDNDLMWDPPTGSRKPLHYLFDLDAAYVPSGNSYFLIHYGNHDINNLVNPLGTYGKPHGGLSRDGEPIVSIRHIFGNLDDENWFDEIWRQTDQFGMKTDSIFRYTKNKNSRVRLLKLAVTETIHDTLLLKSLLRTETGIVKPPIEQIAIIDDDNQWRSLINWVVFWERPRWLSRGIDPTANDPDNWKNPFPERRLKWGELDERWHIFDRLLITNNIEKAENVLYADWEIAARNVKEMTSKIDAVTFPASGLQVKVNYILMFYGPILAFFQLLFLIFWTKQNQGRQQDQFSFPDFDNHSHFETKFVPPTRLTPAEIAQNLLWGLFLFLPVVILLYGIFTHYDFLSFIDLIDEFRALQRDRPLEDFKLVQFLSHQNSGFLSNFFDWINFVTLTLSLIVIYKVTKKTYEEVHGWKNSLYGIGRYLGLIVGLIGVLSLLLKSSENMETNYLCLLIAFLILWTSLWFLSFRKTNMLSAISAIGILASIAFVLM